MFEQEKNYWVIVGLRSHELLIALPGFQHLQLWEDLPPHSQDIKTGLFCRAGAKGGGG